MCAVCVECDQSVCVWKESMTACVESEGAHCEELQLTLSQLLAGEEGNTEGRNQITRYIHTSAHASPGIL